MGRWQSGQMQRAVNPPPLGYVGSNPTLPKSKSVLWGRSSVG